MSDHVRYPSFSFHEAHPDRMAGMAKLLGLNPPDVATSRVLGLGCASGGHLLPMAQRLPNARFVGLDVVAEEIEIGRAYALALNLTNIELLVADLADLVAWQGPFDYIIAHGLYSWLPAPLQPVLLKGIRNALSPHGVAFISWNTQPGWSRRAPVHELIKGFVDADALPQERVRQGRAFAKVLAANTPRDDSTYSRMVHDELDHLQEAHDGFFLGDVAVSHMEPLRYDQFNQRVRAENLQILCDAGGLNPTITGPTHPQVRAAIDQFGDDLIKVECFLDAITGRAFRTTLLVRDDAPAAAGVTGQAMEQLRFSTDLAPPAEFVPGQPAVLASPWGGQAKIDMPILQVLLHAISEQYPARLGLIEVVEGVAELMGSPPNQAMLQQLTMALRMCLGSDLVQAHTRNLPTRPSPSHSPTACPVVRLLASSDALRVPTDTHRALPIDDVDRAVLPLLDGARSIADLVDQTHLNEGDVNQRLQRYWEAGLFIA
ncbi:MAG: methyltransferase domain-containing protein [Rhodobacterales bacterium]|nr:methyltransferase domain-containing protein [Rhodobacterales bacterium]